MHAGSLAQKTEKRKSREIAALCRMHGWSFCPFVVEVFGAWGGQARHFLQRLAKLLALTHGISTKEAALRCRGQIAASVLRSVGRQLERAFGEVAEGASGPPADTYSL